MFCNKTDGFRDQYSDKYIEKLTFFSTKTELRPLNGVLSGHGENHVNPVAMHKNTRYSFFPTWKTLYRTSMSHVAHLTSKDPNAPTFMSYVRYMRPRVRPDVSAKIGSHVMHLKLSNDKICGAPPLGPRFWDFLFTISQKLSFLFSLSKPCVPFL